MNEKHLTCGVDCGAYTGLAIYDAREKKITEFKTTDFFGAIAFIKTLSRETVKIIVEIPSDFIYSRNDFQKGAVRDRMAINIGMDRRESELLAEACRRLGFAVKGVMPVRAKKWTAQQLERYLGIGGRTSRHVRDACRLAFFHSSERI